MRPRSRPSRRTGCRANPPGSCGAPPRWTGARRWRPGRRPAPSPAGAARDSRCPRCTDRCPRRHRHRRRAPPRSARGRVAPSPSCAGRRPPDARPGGDTRSPARRRAPRSPPRAGRRCSCACGSRTAGRAARPPGRSPRARRRSADIAGGIHQPRRHARCAVVEAGVDGGNERAALGIVKGSRRLAGDRDPQRQMTDQRSRVDRQAGVIERTDVAREVGPLPGHRRGPGRSSRSPRA